MRLKLFILLLVSLYACITRSQVFNGFIGLDALPADDAAICEIPLASIDLENIYENDTIPDFRLYDVNGIEVRISDVMLDKKPVLLISCSYTCFVFRKKIGKINTIQSLYGDRVNIYLIYTVEAHPLIDICPYYGEVYTSDENYEDSVLYRQPTTYLERKVVVSEMLDRETIMVPVLIDGPCNSWWEAFGKTPNSAFLIDTNGIIYDAEQWLDRYPDDIEYELQELLGDSVIPEEEIFGVVEFPESSKDCYMDVPGSIIYTGDFVVNNDSNYAVIDISISDLNLPADWNYSICTDVCYSPGIDSATMIIEAGDSIFFGVHFYTSETSEETASIKLKLQNQKINSNKSSFTVKACTSSNVEEPNEVITFYPNPASTFLYINSTSAFITELQLYHINGQLLIKYDTPANTMQIDVSSFPTGIYVLHYMIGESKYSELIAITH